MRRVYDEVVRRTERFVRCHDEVEVLNDAYGLGVEVAGRAFDQLFETATRIAVMRHWR
jgi:hypothetical protein